MTLRLVLFKSHFKVVLIKLLCILELLIVLTFNHLNVRVIIMTGLVSLSCYSDIRTDLPFAVIGLMMDGLRPRLLVELLALRDIIKRSLATLKSLLRNLLISLIVVLFLARLIKFILGPEEIPEYILKLSAKLNKWRFVFLFCSALLL